MKKMLLMFCLSVCSIMSHASDRGRGSMEVLIDGKMYSVDTQIVYDPNTGKELKQFCHPFTGQWEIIKPKKEKPRVTNIENVSGGMLHTGTGSQFVNGRRVNKQEVSSESEQSDSDESDFEIPNVAAAVAGFMRSMPHVPPYANYGQQVNNGIQNFNTGYGQQNNYYGSVSTETNRRDFYGEGPVYNVQGVKNIHTGSGDNISGDKVMGGQSQPKPAKVCVRSDDKDNVGSGPNIHTGSGDNVSGNSRQPKPKVSQRDASGAEHNYYGSVVHRSNETNYRPGQQVFNFEGQDNVHLGTGRNHTGDKSETHGLNGQTTTTYVAKDPRSGAQATTQIGAMGPNVKHQSGPGNQHVNQCNQQ